MDVLFVHQNYPAQFKHLAPALAAGPGNRVAVLTLAQAQPQAGIQIVRYGIARGSSQNIHPFVAEVETKALRGEACARAALRMKEAGFAPDVIVAHPGWGEALFLKDVWPDAKVLNYLEFYYRTKGADVGFDAEFAAPDDFEGRCRLRMKNTHTLLSMEAADWGLSPTRWQRSVHPGHIRTRTSVVFDGIDTAVVRPNPQTRIALEKAGLSLSAQDETITFVNRNLEPYRGFHIFMRALPEILRRRPRAQILIVGGDEVSYGQRLPPGKSYRQIMLDEVGAAIDPARVHFLGRVPYNAFLSLLQASAVHVYLTYPFVLSWSMLEAMAAGCLVVGSATAPVQEVIRDGENGLLVDFFSPAQIADAVDRVLDAPDRLAALRQRARQTILDRYDLRSVCLPRQLRLIETLAAGRLPEPEPEPEPGGPLV